MKSAIVKGVLYAAVFIAGFALIGVLAYLVGPKQDSAILAAGDVDDCEIRNRLLMEALGETGVCSAEEAARVWASGLKERSAALQYAVMNETLKAEYAKQLEKNFPNWVTGLSSPWIEEYEIVQTKKNGRDQFLILLRFTAKASTGTTGSHDALLIVVRDGDYWRIATISADEQLSAYTGYQP